ncbi:MAG: hypothetical protein IK108_01665 [Clostridia bacterium]|nr:hypothetical protein [Clostridia bacterium]
MNKELEHELKRYYKEIRSLLIIRTKESKRFMQEFTASVNDYIDAEEINTIASIKAHFGEPEEIAGSFLESADLRYIRKRLKIKSVIMFAVICALVIWLGVAMAAYIDCVKDNDGYGVERIDEFTTNEKTVMGESVFNHIFNEVQV